jgi:UDP-N-acetylmuramoyl-tripeptide--D-alanyl-D-alanine ligase
MIAVFMRHTLYRLRYFLHMFQQLGYKKPELRHWLSTNLFTKVLTAEHLLYNLVILIMLYFLAERVTLTSGAIIIGIFTIFWFTGTTRYRQEKEKKPLVYTPRMKRLGGFLLIILVFAWYILLDFGTITITMRDFAAPFLNTDPYLLSFGLVVIDMIVPAAVLLAALILQPVETSIQNRFKKQAQAKLATMPGLVVVAITGSYGKTSTKFAIDAFLKERLNVCVTPGSFNTPMGICKVINNNLEASHNVLILEMGARYEGNIKELCDIARPDVSVITNVGLSHLETFGSREAIAREKSTLARELKYQGTLVLNGDDPQVRAMAKLRHDASVIMTGMDGTVRAMNVETGPSGTTFQMQWLNEDGTLQEQERIQTRLLGSHNIQNLLLASAVAKHFNIRLQTIALAASNMQPVEHRLELTHRNGLVVIDDAFNSNPVGAKNAVDVLSSFTSGRKIVITPGMIELGDAEEEQNRRFGRHIGNSDIDLVILVGEDRTRPIYEGIRSAENQKGIEIKIARSLFEANDILAQYARKGDVVLYENDLPDSYETVN